MDKANELNLKELHLSYNSLKNKLINEKRLQSAKFDSVVIDWLNQEMWSTIINDVIQLDIVKSNKQLLNTSQKEIFIKNIELIKKYLGENSADKIKFEQGFTVNEVITASDKLNGWVEEIKNARIDGEPLSNLEKYVYAYMLATNFYYKQSNNLVDSRMLIPVLGRENEEQFIVCSGFSNLLVEILNNLNIPSSVYIIPGHAMVTVRIKDEKYNLDFGFYSDPTFACEQTKNLNETKRSLIKLSAMIILPQNLEIFLFENKYKNFIVSNTDHLKFYNEKEKQNLIKNSNDKKVVFDYEILFQVYNKIINIEGSSFSKRPFNLPIEPILKNKNKKFVKLSLKENQLSNYFKYIYRSKPGNDNREEIIIKELYKIINKNNEGNLDNEISIIVSFLEEKFYPIVACLLLEFNQEHLIPHEWLKSDEVWIKIVKTINKQFSKKNVGDSLYKFKVIEKLINITPSDELSYLKLFKSQKAFSNENINSFLIKSTAKFSQSQYQSFSCYFLTYYYNLYKLSKQPDFVMINDFKSLKFETYKDFLLTIKLIPKQFKNYYTYYEAIFKMSESALKDFTINCKKSNKLKFYIIPILLASNIQNFKLAFDLLNPELLTEKNIIDIMRLLTNKKTYSPSIEILKMLKKEKISEKVIEQAIKKDNINNIVNSVLRNEIDLKPDVLEYISRYVKNKSINDKIELKINSVNKICKGNENIKE